VGSFQAGGLEPAGFYFIEGRGRCASGQVSNHRAAKRLRLLRIFQRVRGHVFAVPVKRPPLERSRGCPGATARSTAEPTGGNSSAPLANSGVSNIPEEDTAISHWAGLLDQRGELDWRPAGLATWIGGGETGHDAFCGDNDSS
jgi:hypothetical protein